MRDGRFINAKKLAALDIVFRGRRTILLEFGFGVFFLGGLGFDFLLFVQHKTPVTTVIGVYLLFLGLNYVPLLVYTVSLSISKAAPQVAAYELEHQDVYRKKYGIQQVLILVPFAIVVLSLVQVARPDSDLSLAIVP